MFRKMKWKFITFVMGSILLLLTVILGSIHLIQIVQMWDRYDQLLSLVLENDGEFTKGFEQKKENSDADSIRQLWHYALKITKETPYENRYFLVYLNESGDVEEVNVRHISSVSEDEAKEMVVSLLENREEYKSIVSEQSSISGTFDSFRYRIAKDDDGDGYIIGFADMYQQIMNNQYLFELSWAMAIAIFSVLFLIVFLASKRVLEPLVQNMEKQKQFITDAGHELKTPLAVISADVDVIELTGGKSEWTDSIRKQITQMTELIGHLLYLSRMEEKFEFIMENQNFSELVSEVVNRMSPIAVSRNKEFHTDIEESIFLRGDHSALEQLISVLTENAIKYCKDDGKIRIRLYKSGRTAHLEIRNTADPIDEKNKTRIFDRFYRPDSARNKKTGGYGIGLSVARAIVIAHKGKISVQNEKEGDENTVAFCVELSMRGSGAPGKKEKQDTSGV